MQASLSTNLLLVVGKLQTVVKWCVRQQGKLAIPFYSFIPKITLFKVSENTVVKRVAADFVLLISWSFTWSFWSSISHRFSLKEELFLLLKLIWNLLTPEYGGLCFFHKYILFLPRVTLSQAQVTEKLVSSFHEINHHTVDKWLGKQLWYPLDRDVSSGMLLSTSYFGKLFTNLEQTPLNGSQQLQAPYKRLIDEIKQN